MINFQKLFIKKSPSVGAAHTAMDILDFSHRAYYSLYSKQMLFDGSRYNVIYLK